jgi:uncharacterized protein YjiS (DUF1127 family)
MATLNIFHHATQHYAVSRAGGIDLQIPTTVTRIANTLLKTFRNWQQRRIDRLAFEHLLELDDRMLSDIGVKREDVIWASKLPLSQNASEALSTIARLK